MVPSQGACSPPGDGAFRLQLNPTTTSPLSIDVAESPEMRIQRLISENPVIIFSRASCCMCDVMKRLLSTVGVHPTVIQLEEDEIGAALGSPDRTEPALYIGGAYVGGPKNLMALHLSNNLVPKLAGVGVLRNQHLTP